ncbi:MAG: glycosyltransferase [Chthoniobacterales bacterium]
MTGNAPTVAFFCATWLKPEMHHIHRQVLAVDGWRPFVLAQKIENAEAFPIEDIEVVPRSPFRFAARAVEKNLTHAPWQISRGEAARMREILHRENARVLHVFFGNVAVHLLPLLETAGIPIVVSFHGADVAGDIATPGYRAAREKIFALAARVACRSDALIEAVHRLGCPREKLRVIRTALPDLKFRERTLPDDGSFRLVQACRLIPKKGLATSLEAFAKLAPRFPKMTFVIAGAGPLEGELRELANRLDVAGRVHFSGFLEQPALRDLLASSNVFLHPSETVNGDTEGIPNGLLEAMATGLPVVATRHGGIPEAVEDGVGGLLCAERDSSAVAAAVERLLTDPVLYASIAANGAAAAHAKFSREAVGALLRDLYDSVDATTSRVAGRPAN